MSRYLIVAHRTLGAPELHERVREIAAEAPASFHLLVPVTDPDPADRTWTESEVMARARERLAHEVNDLRAQGLEATGEIGDVNPVFAVSQLLRRGERFDGVLLSTLPPGHSRWLKLDVANRLSREADTPVEIIVSRTAAQAVG
jgi:hypothetical protein